MNPPQLRIGDWITINRMDCVIAALREPGDPFGLGEVVFDPEKPTSHDFDWDGEKFILPPRPDFGGYADGNPRYRAAVEKLKRGNPA
jgi:hypothetical protein